MDSNHPEGSRPRPSARARSRGRPAVPPARDTVGFRIRAARMQLSTAAGRIVSQVEFAAAVAARLGEPWHQTRLSRLESNESEPTFAELMALADVTGTAITWLAFGIPTTTPEPPAAREAWLERYRARRGDP